MCPLLGGFSGKNVKFVFIRTTESNLAVLFWRDINNISSDLKNFFFNKLFKFTYLKKF